MLRHPASGFRHAAAACGLALGMLWLPALAGQASSTFQVTIELLAGDAVGCSAGVDGSGARVSCPPVLVAPPSGTTTVVRPPRAKAATRVAGTLVEVAEENHATWTDSRVLWSEYSYRRVLAGGREYVEMTLSW